MAGAAGSNSGSNNSSTGKPVTVRIDLLRIQAPVFTYGDRSRQFATELEAAMNQYLDAQNANWRRDSGTESAPAVFSGLAPDYSGFPAAIRPNAPANVSGAEKLYVYQGQALEEYRPLSSGVLTLQRSAQNADRMVAMATHLKQQMASQTLRPHDKTVEQHFGNFLTPDEL